MTDPETQHPPGLLHLGLLVSGILDRIPPLAVAPALAGMAAIGAWPWDRPVLQVAVGLSVAFALLADGVSLALLPRRGRSWGPVTPPLLALALLRMTIALALGALWPTLPAAIAGAIIQALLTAVQVYATWVEPFRLTVTPLAIASPKLQHGEPLRILHLSDIHYEGHSPRERRLLETAGALAPDLILLTGDYLNLSSVDNERAQQGARNLLAELVTVAPTYAVVGSPLVDRPGVVPEIFAGIPITWLVDEVAPVEVKGYSLLLVGVRCTAAHRRDGERLRSLLPDAPRRFTVLLYHSPDIFPVAAELGIDLHLAGHTHGGQLCLPLFGAIVTSSAFWKRYEAGLYREGQTTLYVSRGIGVEGAGAPRARFLAPPEIVLLTLRSAERLPQNASPEVSGESAEPSGMPALRSDV